MSASFAALSPMEGGKGQAPKRALFRWLAARGGGRRVGWRPVGLAGGDEGDRQAGKEYAKLFGGLLHAGLFRDLVA